MSLSSYKGLGLALVLASMTVMGGCDGKQEAEPNPPKDRLGSAFEEGLRGCAVVAENLGRKWVGKPYTDLETWMSDNVSSDVAAVRAIRPNTAVTRDYRVNRLNISLDDKDVVTKFYCG